MPPDKFDALATAVRKLREDAEAGRAAADKEALRYNQVSNWWYAADGRRGAHECNLALIDTLIAEHGIEQ